MPKSMEKEQSKIDKTNLSMPAPVQAKMEQSFGTNFSNVNFVESNTVADYGAQAVTKGNTVAFAPGYFNPSTYEGQSLIGHELSHVVSQAKGEVHAPQGKGLNFVADARLESKADQEGRMAALGQKVSGSQGTVIGSMSSGNMPIQGKLPWKPQTEEDIKKKRNKEFKKNFSDKALAKAYDKLKLKGMNINYKGTENYFQNAQFGKKIAEGVKNFERNEANIRAVQSSGSDVKAYDKAIEAEGANWIKENLTAEEFLLLIDYTDSEYVNYNGFLRDPSKFSEEQKAEYADKTGKLKNAIGRYKNPIRRTLYRGVRERKSIRFLVGSRYNAIENRIQRMHDGLEGDKINDPFSADHDDLKRLASMYNEELQGAAFMDKGFGSATYNVGVAKAFAGSPKSALLYEIDYPAGLSFAPIGTAYSANPSESELLIPPSTIMVFEKSEVNNEGYMVFKVRAIGSDSEGTKK